MMRDYSRRIFCIVVLLMLAACGLKKEDVAEVKTLQGQLTQNLATVGIEEKRFTDWLATADAKPYLSTATREKWKDIYFQETRKTLALTQSRIDGDIAAILKRNTSDDNEQLAVQLLSTRRSLNKAMATLGGYQIRKKAISELIAKSGELVVKATTTTSGTKSRIEAYILETQRVEGEYPDKRVHFLASKTKAGEMVKRSEESLAFTRTELAKSEPDYGLIIDALGRIEQAKTDSIGHVAEQSTLHTQLRSSYSKTLIDMRVDYYATVTRISWDESSDWDTEKSYVYPPIKIDVQMTQVLDDPKWDEAPIGSAMSFFGARSKHSIPDNIWNTLALDLWANRPSGHDEAEYFADTNQRYYHKYRIEKDGQITETDWVEVNEATFDSTDEFLGMTLESKPYGLFASETDKTASPDGLGYVGNPAYGTWKKDPSGTSFWEWYGRYSLYRDILGGHTYSNNEWDTWRNSYRGKKVYHGGTDDTPRYGSSGSVTSSSGRYAKTEYYRTSPPERGAATGNNSNGSQRGSGAQFRGRGPGGGGK